MVLLAQPLSRRLLLLLQSHAALLGGRLSSAEHTVNLPQSLRKDQRRIKSEQGNLHTSYLTQKLKTCMGVCVSVVLYI